MSLDAFHNHLDACAQCRNNPFGLCPEGDKRIRAAVADTQPRDFSMNCMGRRDEPDARKPEA